MKITLGRLTLEARFIPTLRKDSGKSDLLLRSIWRTPLPPDPDGKVKYNISQRVIVLTTSFGE